MVHNEKVWTCLGSPCTVRSKLNNFEHVFGTRAGTGDGYVPIQRGLGPGGPYIVRSNALWIMVKWDSHMDRMTDRHDWKHYIPELLWRGGNYCCYRDNGDFTQQNKPSLNVCCNSWRSWSNRSVFCHSVFVPATYHQVHILAPHIL